MIKNKMNLILILLIGYLSLGCINTYAELDGGECTNPTKTEVDTYVKANKNNLNGIKTYVQPYIDCIHSDEVDYEDRKSLYEISTINNNSCFIELKNNSGRVIVFVPIENEGAYDINPTPTPTKDEVNDFIWDAVIDYLIDNGLDYDDLELEQSGELLDKINDYRRNHTYSFIGNTECYNYENHKLINVEFEGTSKIIYYCNNGVFGNTESDSDVCSCDDWTFDKRDVCVGTGSWITNEVACTTTRQCIQNSIRKSTTKIGTNFEGTCSVTCNPKLDETNTGTVSQPITCPTIQCGSHNGEIYTALDTTWRTGTFCTSGTEPSVTFPAIDSTKTWTCGTVTCSASRTDGTGGGSCGDGKEDIGEECDLGYLNNGIGNCTTSCTIPECTGPTCGGGEDPYCGDGEEDAGEQCDDHNNISGDGCSSTCTEEGTDPGGYCGDGEVQGSEECDDGNYIGNDSCTNSCNEGIIGWPNEKGYCGDGKVQIPNSFGFKEDCDDGNTNNNDNTCTNNCTLPHNSLPSDGSIEASTICSTSSSGFANNSDTIPIYAKLTIDNLKDSKDVINLGTPTNFTDLSNNVTDRVNMIGDTSLTFSGIEINWNPAGGTTQNIQIGTVSSKTPFVDYTNKISFNLAGQTIVLDGVCYNFKKPYIGKLALISSGSISLGTKLRYTLSADLSNNPILGITDRNISLGINNISHFGADITLQKTSLMHYAGGLYRNFETRINSSIYATKLNQNPGLQVILPVISYKLGGETVRYYLSTYDYGNDKTPITIAGDKFLGVKIIGGLQGAGKYEFTGQGKNISNLYPSDLRTEIRKKAYDYISNMTNITNGSILNKVKYVNGDIKLSGEIPDNDGDLKPDYETLVVKNGNVIIYGNLNQSNKKLGIIILKDNYNTSNGYYYEGNILVTPNVTNINAMIYADGGFMSANSSLNVYTTDSTARTNELQNQLTLNGVMFTRNTIGGAQFGGVKNGGTYILPGGTKTQSFDKAMVYDLNYIRRGNNGCDLSTIPNGCTDPGEYEEGFIIKYDSRIQTNPPKLFYK